MLDLWYKNAVIYCVDLDLFRDANGDGVGDFQGLSDRLHHLEALGVNCIWVMPFFPTPNRDNGYDIVDFYGVDKRFGSLGDFVNFTHAAHDRGMRVIIDLVVNHTSIDHPWFQASRSDPSSPYRDWYVWSEEKPESISDGVVFPGVQDAVWTYDEVAEAWYLHRFYEHQADLNITNPAVREEIDKIIGFWLALGVSGFRLDAVPFLIEYKGLKESERPSSDPHRYLTHLRDFVAWRRAGGVLLAEANIPFDQADEYFGDGDRLHMIFNFMWNQKLFLSLARGDARALRKSMEETPEIPESAHWAIFLRNHDELDLGRLSDEEREETFRAFAPDDDMRIYQRGIRRRLAPMLGGDCARLRMVYSLLFALPGAPVLYYGEEIGMGDDLSLPERMAVRTPMQWSDGPNAGFSDADPGKLPLGPIDTGPFDFRAVNVSAQQEAAGSLLEHCRSLARVRRSCTEIGWGRWRSIDAGDDRVLALKHSWENGKVLTLHNFSNEKISVSIECSNDPVFLRKIIGVAEIPARTARKHTIELPAYGYTWMRMQKESDCPQAKTSGSKPEHDSGRKRKQ